MKRLLGNWWLLTGIVFTSAATFLHMKTIGWVPRATYVGYFISPFIFGFVLAFIYWGVVRN